MGALRSANVIGVGVLLAVLWALPAMAAKDTLIVALDTKYASMDNYATSQTNLVNLFFLVGDPLVERSQDGSIRPHLVTEWKNIDPTSWEFKLREGVRFHNGNELTAESVRFTMMDFILDPNRKAPMATAFKWVKGVEVTGKYTFRIITRDPYPLVVERLVSFFPYDPAHVKEKGAAIAEQPVGTGPYRFVKWDRESRLEITANEHYWKPGLPKIKNIVFRTLPEMSTRLAELISGGVDLVLNLDPDKMDLVQGNPALKVITSPTYRINFYQFDGAAKASQTPLTDVRVRRAIWHAIDREAIINNVLAGQAELLNTPVTRFHYGYDPKLPGYEYSPERAKALLGEAGYGNGFTVDIWQYYNVQNQFNQAAMAYLEKVGIKLNFKDYRGNVGQLITMRNTGKVTGIGNYAWGSLFVFDADAVLTAWFLTDDPKCYNNDPELDKLLREAGSILDQNRRKELYSQAQRRIIEQAYWMPTFLQYQIMAAKRDLEVSASPDEMISFHHAYWK
jgi:peptide/nickel transport system substrate-binding protein